MASHFTITLDTTAPVVEVHAPAYVTRQVSAEVFVQADEALSYQDIVVIDSEGTEHPQTFLYEPGLNRYRGIVSFHGYPVGEATIRAQVKDEVHNPSPVVTKTLTVLRERKGVTLEVSDSPVYAVSLSESSMHMETRDHGLFQVHGSQSSRHTETGDTGRQPTIQQKKG